MRFLKLVTITSAAILAAGETIGAEGFAELVPRRALSQGAAPGAALARLGTSGGVLSIPVGTTLAQAERELIIATLARSTNRREAARMLGLGLRTLYTKLRQYRIDTGPGAETA